MDSDEKVSPERMLVNGVSGCLYAAYVVALSAGMLFLNALLCLTIYSAFPKNGDEEITSRLGQMFFLIVPILLLIVEWHVYDRIQRLFRRGTR